MSTRTVTRLQHHLWTAHGLADSSIDYVDTETQHSALHAVPRGQWPANAVRHDLDQFDPKTLVSDQQKSVLRYLAACEYAGSGTIADHLYPAKGTYSQRRAWAEPVLGALLHKGLIALGHQPHDHAYTLTPTGRDWVSFHPV